MKRLPPAVLLLLLAAVPPVLSYQSGVGTGQREATLNVNIVFVGFDKGLLEINYTLWNLDPLKHQSVLVPGVSNNVVYRFNTTFAFAEDDFARALANHLSDKGIQRTLENPFFDRKKVKSTFYGADELEQWIVDHWWYFGMRQKAYNVLVMNLTDYLPSITYDQYSGYLSSKALNFTAHYYNQTYVDSDLGLRVARHYMTAWGGHHRLYFLDLSAGPSYWTNQLPLQVVVARDGIDLRSPYGRKWLAQYVSDYLTGAFQDLVAPDMVYEVNYAPRYSIRILLVDNRTDNRTVSLEKTVNGTEVASRLRGLLPFADIDVSVNFLNVTSSPELVKRVIDSTYPKNGTDIVDARPIHEWFDAKGQGRLSRFLDLNQTGDEYVIPVVAFAFGGKNEFGFTFKERIRDEEGFDRGIWGVALEDMVLIGHSTEDLMRGEHLDPKQSGKGYGFTNTIVHEVGHKLGLPHPSQYDKTQDFVASVMAYYPYEPGFSAFDRDAEMRGFADKYLLQTNLVLARARNVLVNYPHILLAESDARAAESFYAEMNYSASTSFAYRAWQHAIKADEQGGWVPVEALAISAAVVGLVVLRSRRRIK